MNAISKYLATIGAKGGRKRAAHPKRVELAKRAANTRWSNAKRLSKHEQCQSAQPSETK